MLHLSPGTDLWGENLVSSRQATVVLSALRSLLEALPLKFLGLGVGAAPLLVLIVVDGPAMSSGWWWIYFFGDIDR